MVLIFLHVVALPTFSGGYNDECYLPDEKRRILRFMVEEISIAFDKFGLKYWLDYGKCGTKADEGPTLKTSAMFSCLVTLVI